MRVLIMMVTAMVEDGGGRDEDDNDSNGDVELRCKGEQDQR